MSATEGAGAAWRPAGERAEGGSARLAYVVTTLLVSAAGTAVVGWLRPADALAVGAGVFTAWAIQAISFWELAGRLGRGQDVLRTWIAGMGARAGGLVLAYVAGAGSALSRSGLLLGYGVAILSFLLLEAGWLALHPPAGGARRPNGPGRGASAPEAG